MRRPYPPLLARVSVSSFVLWLLIRATYAAILVLGSPGAGMFSSMDAMHYAVHPAWLVRVVLVFVTAFLVRLDQTHAHEHLLIANFGVAGSWFTTTSLATAALTDLTCQTIVDLLYGAT